MKEKLLETLDTMAVGAEAILSFLIWIGAVILSSAVIFFVVRFMLQREPVVFTVAATGVMCFVVGYIWKFYGINKP